MQNVYMGWNHFEKQFIYAYAQFMYDVVSLETLYMRVHNVCMGTQSSVYVCMNTQSLVQVCMSKQSSVHVCMGTQKTQLVPG